MSFIVKASAIVPHGGVSAATVTTTTVTCMIRPPRHLSLQSLPGFCARPLPRVRILQMASRSSGRIVRSNAQRSVGELEKGIADFYDASSGVWEDIWGEHMHHGFYDIAVNNSSNNYNNAVNHVSAQIRMIEEALSFAGISDDPKNVLDVGCGIGGSSRYLAKKYGATVTGITLSPIQAQRANALTAAQGLADRVLLDLVALNLPRVIVSYVDISDACREICESIANCVWQTCNPRDMVPVLCEALCSVYTTSKKLSSCLPLLGGFCIVVSRIQRRHVEHVRSALPAILNIGKAAASKATDDDNENVAMRVFEKLIVIAISLQEVCKKELGSKSNILLRSILGLYTLQLLALISKDRSIAHSVIISKVPSLVLQLSELLSYCGFSYLGLITGREVEVAMRLVVEDGDDLVQESTSLVNHGATLAVLWGYIFEEVAKVASESVDTLLGRLKSCKWEKMRALSMMKYFLSSLDYTWHIKKHAIEFLSTMVQGDKSPSKDFDEKIDWPSIIPSLFSLFQALQQVMVYAPDPELRKKSFSALKEVLTELPPHQKFDMLKALIINSNYPSMVSLLLGIVRDEISNVILKRIAPTSQEAGLRDEESALESPFVTGDVLELVEVILKPAKGGPPDLPGQSDAVLAALNLYRFLLMMESHGKTNYTQVLSKCCLQKAYSEWLLPLRVLVSGIRSENENDYSEFANSTICAINPIELVLYHCLELVEENLRHCT